MLHSKWESAADDSNSKLAGLATLEPSSGPAVMVVSGGAGGSGGAASSGFGLGAGLAMGQQMINAMNPGGHPPAPAAPAPAAPSTPPASGAPAAAAEGNKFCINCGKPMPKIAKFCPECGGGQA